MLEWDGRVVVEADRFYVLDAEGAAAVPLRLPGVEQVVGLATWGRRGPLVLDKGKGGLRLLARADGRWADLGLPPEVRGSAKPPLLCADESSAVLLGESRLFCLTQGPVQRLPLQPPPKNFFLAYPWMRDSPACPPGPREALPRL